jgi:hypothetical protein
MKELEIKINFKNIPVVFCRIKHSVNNLRKPYRVTTEQQKVKCQIYNKEILDNINNIQLGIYNSDLQLESIRNMITNFSITFPKELQVTHNLNYALKVKEQELLTPKTKENVTT